MQCRGTAAATVHSQRLLLRPTSVCLCSVMRQHLLQTAMMRSMAMCPLATHPQAAQCGEHHLGDTCLANGAYVTQASRPAALLPALPTATCTATPRSCRSCRIVWRRHARCCAMCLLAPRLWRHRNMVWACVLQPYGSAATTTAGTAACCVCGTSRPTNGGASLVWIANAPQQRLSARKSFNGDCRRVGGCTWRIHSWTMSPRLQRRVRTGNARSTC